MKRRSPRQQMSFTSTPGLMPKFQSKLSLEGVSIKDAVEGWVAAYVDGRLPLWQFAAPALAGSEKKSGGEATANEVAIMVPSPDEEAAVEALLDILRSGPATAARAILWHLIATQECISGGNPTHDDPASERVAIVEETVASVRLRAERVRRNAQLLTELAKRVGEGERPARSGARQPNQRVG